MKKSISLFSLIFIFLLSLEVYSQTKPDIDMIDNAIVVVMIYDYKGNQLGHGSGFIIDEMGTVITNYHVIKGASSLKIKIDINGYKEIYEVEKIISGDPSKDLAKISIKNPYSKKFPYLILSKTFPTKGEDCWAIGTPADEKYMNTVSKGLISNIDKYSDPKILQTNAEITNGSSGGALINSKGEVIGVTTAGDGSKDGARASINFAVWIGEIYNLPHINKKSVVDPASIPCQLGFYTNSPYIGYVYFYIDQIYIGSFTKYFQNNLTPNCGDYGTITRYLYAGTHTYQIYYASTRQWSYGSITLSPGQCQIFKVGGNNPSQTSYPYYNYNKISNNNKKDYSKIKDYRFMLGTRLSSINFITYVKDGKYGVQGFWGLQKSENGEDTRRKETRIIQKYGVDIRRVFRSDKKWSHFYFGPSFRIIHSKLNIDSTSLNSSFGPVWGSRTQKGNQFFFNGRTGVEFVFFNWFALNLDAGIGYLTGDYFPGYLTKKRDKLWGDIELVIGIRF
jgi:hypothetical protein